MDAIEIKERIKKIIDAQDDPEKAHAMEDDLYQDLLSSIARGECTEPERCAQIALRTQHITFPRWCA